MTRPKRKKYGWLWASLGVLVFVFGIIVVGTWWSQRAPGAVDDEQKPEPIAAPPAPVEPDATVADVGTDAVLEEAPPLEEAVAEEPPVEAVDLEEPPLPPEPEPSKPKAKKKRAKPKKKTAPAPVPVPVPAPANEPTPVPEPDDGIDWTVPDFPQEPAPPTGTPDAPPRNPVVIDEPPTQ